MSTHRCFPRLSLMMLAAALLVACGAEGPLAGRSSAAASASDATRLIENLLDPGVAASQRRSTVEGDLTQQDLSAVNQLLLTAPGPVSVLVENARTRGSALEFQFELTVDTTNNQVAIGTWHGVVCRCDGLRLSRLTFCDVLSDLSDQPCGD